MMINGISNAQAVSFGKVTQRTTNPAKAQKPDSFEKEAFDYNGAMKTLGDLTYEYRGKSVPKFNSNQLNNLGKILKKTPEKWTPVKTMASSPLVGSRVVLEVASKSKNVVDAMLPFVMATKIDKTSQKEVAKYSDYDIKTLSDLNAAKINKAQTLLPTSLSVKNIVAMVDAPKLKNQLQKAADRVLEMEQKSGSNLKNIVFDSDKYEKNDFNIQVENEDYSSNKVTLDKNLDPYSVESTHFEAANEKIYNINKANDLRNNTISKSRYEVSEDGNMTLVNEIRIVKDKNGKLQRTEYVSPSKVKGVFDIVYRNAEGAEKVVSSGKIDKKSGITTIKKDMTSLDGTRTTVLYEDDPQGNRISEYKIVDKNGKVLLNNNNTFEVVSENKFISSKNDQKYEILLDEHQLQVTDLNNKARTATISIDKDIDGNKEAILKSLKSMPGEELFKVADTTQLLVGNSEVLESYYDTENKAIVSGSDLFVILHELGHARDFRDLDLSSEQNCEASFSKLLNQNKNIQKAYDTERKAFNKAFPDAQREYIDYFINKVDHYGGETGGLEETIAESNALLTTPRTHELLGIRSQYLQQYFPKTIAALDTELNKLNV